MKQVVNVAFYKNYKDTIYDRLISFWTKSPHTHCELVIEGMWYSSSPRDNGVRAKRITSHLEHWDCIELQLHPFNVEKIVEFFKREDGKKYDWTGILFSQIIQIKRQESSKWFCSEIVSKALKIGGVRLPNCNQCYSPASLFRDLEQMYKINT